MITAFTAPAFPPQPPFHRAAMVALHDATVSRQKAAADAADAMSPDTFSARVAKALLTGRALHVSLDEYQQLVLAAANQPEDPEALVAGTLGRPFGVHVIIDRGLVPAGELPDLVEPGWEDALDVGHGHRMLFYRDGTVRFEHRCDRGERGLVMCAPRLQLDGGHRIVSRAPFTVTPSILCPDCGTHGHVRDGSWVPC